MNTVTVTAETSPAAFSVRDAARYMGLGESTVWKLIAEKDVEAKRRAGRTLVIRTSCDEYLDALPSSFDAAA